MNAANRLGIQVTNPLSNAQMEGFQKVVEIWLDTNHLSRKLIFEALQRRRSRAVQNLAFMNHFVSIMFDNATNITRKTFRQWTRGAGLA